MAYNVEFKKIATTGLEQSPVKEALAGLRANEARYFFNKYKHEFVTLPASEGQKTLQWIEEILEERKLRFPYTPLEVSEFIIDDTRWAYVFYENGLVVNVLYSLTEGGKRAVGFKLSDGIEIPEEFAGKFKFARQKSKLAGTIRGSFFVIKGTH